MEMLEARTLLSAAVIPADVPPGYFRYWGAGSNPADRDPELAVPFLAGQGTFTGTLATFWGDAPEATRVYARLKTAGSASVDDPYSYYGGVDPRWQSSEIVDVPGPTFEVHADLKLPAEPGRAASDIAFVNDAAANSSYVSDGPTIVFGDPKRLAGQNDSPVSISMYEKGTCFVSATLLDRFFEDGDQYRAVFSADDGLVLESKILTGERYSWMQPTDVQLIGPPLQIDGTKYPRLNITFTRLDGRAAGTFVVAVSDHRLAPEPSVPVPTEPADPVVDSTSERPLYTYNDDGMETENFMYPATIESVAYLKTYDRPIPKDVQFSVQINGGPEIPVSRRVDDQEELTSRYFTDLYIEPHALAAGENRITIIGRRLGQEIYRNDDNVAFAYERRLGIRAQSFYGWRVREGEMTDITSLGGIVYDEPGFRLEDYSATLTLDDGRVLPVGLQAIAGPKIMHYALSTSLSTWFKGNRLAGSEAIEGTVTVRRGVESVSFRTHGEVTQGDWIAPTDSLEWLGLPRFYSVGTPRLSVNGEELATVTFEMQLLQPDLFEMPDLSITGYFHDALPTKPIVVTRIDDGNVRVTAQFDCSFAFPDDPLTLELSSPGKTTPDYYIPLGNMVNAAIGESTLRWAGALANTTFVSGEDYFERGVGIGVLFAWNANEDVSIDEYSAEVKFEDGSVARAFVTSNPVHPTHIVVSIQPHFTSTGEKPFTLTIRFRDQAASFSALADVQPPDVFLLDLDELKNGENTVWILIEDDKTAFMSQYAVRTKARPLPPVVATIPPPPVVDSGEEMPDDVLTPAPEEEHDEAPSLAGFWLAADPVFPEARTRPGYMLLNEDGADDEWLESEASVLT
jgi:hypothetical protein